MAANVVEPAGGIPSGERLGQRRRLVFCDEGAPVADPAAALVRTNSKHIALTGALQSGQPLRPRERSPDGNGVSMEDQLTKVADTSSTQELVANLYRKYQGMFRTAMGRAG